MDLRKGQKMMAVMAALTVLLVGGFALEKYIIPEESVQKDEQLPGDIQQKEKTDNTSQETTSDSDSSDTEMTVLSSGTFTGKAGHDVSGTVKVIEIEGEQYLRFEDYEQTQGPDVFVYLTESEDPDTDQQISNGEKIRIDGGPDGGEITKEGNFNQKIPENIDAENYRGVAVWCDAFSVPFGSATLKPN